MDTLSTLKHLWQRFQIRSFLTDANIEGKKTNSVKDALQKQQKLLEQKLKNSRELGDEEDDKEEKIFFSELIEDLLLPDDTDEVSYADTYCVIGVYNMWRYCFSMHLCLVLKHVMNRYKIQKQDCVCQYCT